MSILTATEWRNNSWLIKDVAALGYLEGDVLDCTFGLGNFWKKWHPQSFVACDLNAALSPVGYSVDFRELPFDDASFDAVVCDPPYKLAGTSTPEVDGRYGVDEYMKWQDRHAIIKEGITECSRVTKRRGFVLLKCQDQVCSGKKRWQTIEFPNHAETVGLTLVDRFDMLHTPRPQDPRRHQLHSQQNYSTLLVFRKEI